MTKRLMTLAALAVLALPFGAVHAQAQEASWIHVRMDNPDDEVTASLNLPASMITVALEMVREEGFDRARLGDGDQAVDLDDLRRMWPSVRDAGDAEFVDVQDGDAHVRVFREGDRFYVHADGEDGESVRVEMPVEIADILLGTGEEIDVQAAIEELARRGEPDLIQISGPDGTVRMWVDGRPGQDR